jgi:hypothetical protein
MSQSLNTNTSIGGIPSITVLPPGPGYRSELTMQCGKSIQTIPTIKDDTYKFQPVSYLENTHGVRSLVKPVYPDDSLLLVAPADLDGSRTQKYLFTPEATIKASEDCIVKFHSPSLGDRYLGQAVKGQELKVHTEWSLIRTRKPNVLEMGNFRRGDRVWVNHYDGSVASSKASQGIQRPEERVRV